MPQALERSTDDPSEHHPQGRHHPGGRDAHLGAAAAPAAAVAPADQAASEAAQASDAYTHRGTYPTGWQCHFFGAVYEHHFCYWTVLGYELWAY